MSRYFCVIFLLLTLNSSLWCTDNNAKNSKHNLKRHKISEKNYAQRRIHKRQEYDSDREPVVSIDVASFIQQPDYDTENGLYTPDGNKKKIQAESNNYHEYDALIESGSENESPNKAPDYSKFMYNLADSDANLYWSLPPFKKNKKPLNSNGATTIKDYPFNVHKKSVKNKNNKLLRFPFFSHKKTTKPAKVKKRGLYKALLNVVKPVTVSATTEKANSNPYFYQSKRSYQECLCPACKRKYIANMDLSDEAAMETSTMIHNSRQYFQQVSQELPVGDKMDKGRLKRADDKTGSSPDSGEMDRKASSAKDVAAAQRRLEEINQIERKVNNVHIHEGNQASSKSGSKQDQSTEEMGFPFSMRMS